MASWKRLMDVAGASVGLLVTSPVMAAAALAIRAKLGRPVLFAQVRPGHRGELFTMYKFRTMSDARGPDGKLLPDAQRLGVLGRLLRKTSIDELPELFNVLKGDMSLVGPRPLLVEYLERYDEWQARRHDAKPGITGWAQINGRNALDWDEKFKLDLWYVDHQSVLLDIKILVLTVWQVIRPTGIDHTEGVPMPIFQGAKHD